MRDLPINLLFLRLRTRTALSLGRDALFLLLLDHPLLVLQRPQLALFLLLQPLLQLESWRPPFSLLRAGAVVHLEIVLNMVLQAQHHSGPRLTSLLDTRQ